MINLKRVTIQTPLSCDYYFHFNWYQSLVLWFEHLTVYQEKIQKEVILKPENQSTCHICNIVAYLKTRHPLNKKVQRWQPEMTLKKKKNSIHG